MIGYSVGALIGKLIRLTVSIHSCYYFLSGSAFFTAPVLLPPLLSSPANLTSRFTHARIRAHTRTHTLSFLLVRGHDRERLGNAYTAHADTIIGNVSFVPALFCGFSPSIRRRGRRAMKSVLNYVLSCRYFQREFVPIRSIFLEIIQLSSPSLRSLQNSNGFFLFFFSLIDSRFKNSLGRRVLFSKAISITYYVDF